MMFLGIELSVGVVPPLDPGFLPLGQFNKSFLRTARQPFHIAAEREGGAVSVYHTLIHGTLDRFDADVFYVERAVKTLLWTHGGFRVYLSGDESVCRAVADIYSTGGPRAFDVGFMADVYGHAFEMLRVEAVPEKREFSLPMGGHSDGCRIGFDAGGSDRKVAAVMEGRVVFSRETVWQPKTAADPRYHYDGVVASLRDAAAHLPRVDAVGISTAGICIGGRVTRSALFEQVPREVYRTQVPDLYRRAVADVFGDVPCAIANDGDVSALAGAAILGQTDVLGIAMGTSEAAGFVDGKGRITGWLNELAFVPVNADPSAPTDPWSGDRGCGVSYLSQEAVIRLAENAGIPLDNSLSPAEKLSSVQALAEGGDPRAEAVFDTVGVYLAHALAQYHSLYRFRQVLLLGRVTSGTGGDRLLRRCESVLAADYPAVANAAQLHLPRERLRRLGQAEAAARLPVTKTAEQEKNT